MKHPFRTGYRLSGITLSIMFSFPLLTGRTEIVPAFLFAVVAGIPAWLVMGCLLGVALSLMAVEERPKVRAVSVARMRAREEIEPEPQPTKESGPFLRLDGEITAWGWPQPRKAIAWNSDASRTRS